MSNLSHLPLKFLTLLYLFMILKPSCCDIQTISLNIPTIYTLRSHTFLEFQVSENISLGLGTFQVLVTSINSQQMFGLQLKYKKCNSTSDEDSLPLQQAFSFQDAINVSFNANASETQCFQLESLTPVPAPSFENYSVLVTFNQINNIIHFDKPYKTQLKEKTNTEFAFNLEGQKVEMFMITAKSAISTSLMSPEISNLVLKMEALCLKGSISESWLCYLANSERITKFSIYNPTSFGAFEITLTKFKSETAALEFEKAFKSFIPGFGSVFNVNVASEGTLKIKAKYQDSQIVSINAAPSLLELFEMLAFSRGDMESQYTKRDQEGALLIQNRKRNTEWYYFVQEMDNTQGDFLIISHFIEQVTLDIDTQAKYYINPEIYQYQEVRLNVGRGNYFSKYQANLLALQPASSIDLYYSTDQPRIPCLTCKNRNSILYEVNSEVIDDKKISLSFTVMPYETSIYLTIHATQKGYYVLQVKKIESVADLRMTIPIILVSYIVGYVAIYIFRMFKSRKSNEFEEINDFSNTESDQSQPNILQEVNLEGGLSPNQFMMENHSIVNDLNQRKVLDLNLMNILQKLKSQFDNEKFRDIKSQGVAGVEETDVKTQDEKRCDICFEAKKTIKFEPCGHNCACSFCSLIIIQMSMSCPLCRQKINNIETPRDIEIEIDGRQEHKVTA